MANRGSMPARGPDQQAWLFQASVGHNDLSQDLPTRKPGDGGKWNVRQNRDLMVVGQPILLWNSGPNAGIYGAAHLTSLPQFGDLPGIEWPSEWWIDYEIDAILDPFISRESLKSHPVLSRMHIMRSPRGTNFKLTPDEWDAVVELAAKG